MAQQQQQQQLQQQQQQQQQDDNVMRRYVPDPILSHEGGERIKPNANQCGSQCLMLFCLKDAKLWPGVSDGFLRPVARRCSWKCRTESIQLFDEWFTNLGG